MNTVVNTWELSIYILQNKHTSWFSIWRYKLITAKVTYTIYKLGNTRTGMTVIVSCQRGCNLDSVMVHGGEDNFKMVSSMSSLLAYRVMLKPSQQQQYVL